MPRRRSKGPNDLTVLLRVVRLGFVLLLVLLAMLYVIRIGASPTGQMDVQLAITWWFPLAASVALGLVFLAIDVFTPIKKIQIISGVVFGLVAGLVASWAIGAVIDLVVETWDLTPTPIIPALKVLFGVSLAYLGITTVLQTQDEFRLVIPYVEFSKRIRGPRPLLLDSSALIDGRIAEILRTDLVQQPVLIPQFVVEELQSLADSSDKSKRARGRRGLEMVARLQRMPGADVSIETTPVTPRGVDQMLLELGEELPAAIMTTDSGLARVAAIQGVKVINLHEIASAMRPAVLPGQTVTVELIRPGEHEGQAVGFLADGTMVVAEEASGLIGRSVELVLTSSMQTAAGRLLFARAAGTEARAEASGAGASDAGDAPGTDDAPAGEGTPVSDAVRAVVAPGGVERRGASRRNPRR